MKHETTHIDGDVNRYTFDFGVCHTSKGFAQLDTSQDAEYYGVWINPTARTAIRWCEGDMTIFHFDDNEEMVAWVAAYKDGGRMIGIDPGLGEVLKSECIAAGLGPYLH